MSTSFEFTSEDVLRRARAAGVDIDDDQLEAVTKSLVGSLGALAAFDLREHKFDEPAVTFSALDPRA